MVCKPHVQDHHLEAAVELELLIFWQQEEYKLLQKLLNFPFF